ncbi:histidine-rich glycoprotein-like [Penaeus japonicus]|uniref:histidine-rich glycoprotein-like n=1 Tax=Penaeus japonicus TaxID=27405 RepID=UPI001C715260|nr:histidine-rich glycoprotein-like [Penaeus japonicus]
MATKIVILALAALALVSFMGDASAAVTHRHALHPAHRLYHYPYYHHYPYRHYPYPRYYAHPLPLGLHPHHHAHATSYVHVNHGAPVKEAAEEEVDAQES